MRTPLTRVIAACRASLVQRSLRGRISSQRPAIPLLVKHIARGTAVDISAGWRRLSGTAGRGAGERNFGDEIADLNAEIEGFVGDLGDPDFDTTAPSGPRRDARDATGDLRGNNTQPGGTPAEQQQAVQGIGSKRPRHRLTQADHPPVAHIPGLDLDAEPEQPDWSASLITERYQDGNQARGTKSVVVLNGAACFIAGKLASTGEPRDAIAKSMEAAAEELNLSLTVCTSNREDELLDKLCEGGYDAIVYNPSGFRHAGSGDSTATAPAHPTQALPLTAIDSDVVVQPEGEKGALRGRQPTRSDSRQQQFLRDAFQKQGGAGRAVEYGLARARCPVVIVAPRDSTAPETRVPGQRGTGVISGFSGVVSYRLAMVAVASVLDDHR